MLKKCKYCNEEFETNANGRYCSDICYKIVRKEQKRINSIIFREKNPNYAKEYDSTDERKLYFKQYREENKEKEIERHKEYRENNKEKIEAYNKKYVVDNKDSLDAYEEKRRSTTQYKQYHNEYMKKYNTELRKNPHFRLNHNISRGISLSLNDQGLSKNRRHWENMVGYKSSKLVSHLENLFTDGMTWENYGKWHVDHIIPKTFFNFNDNVEFKYCWSLDNLQPLWAKDNLSKGNKIKCLT